MFQIVLYILQSTLILSIYMDIVYVLFKYFQILRKSMFKIVYKMSATLFSCQYVDKQVVVGLWNLTKGYALPSMNSLEVHYEPKPPFKCWMTWHKTNVDYRVRLLL